ncbi:MAG: DEAD/DEAH box helicase [Puniceicoccaceae bacterium]
MTWDGLDSITDHIRIPDFWQQEAIQAIREGQDVVLAAPTGAGKTFVFEYLIEHGFNGRAVYTVPTRALANDKRMEWQERGWRVGIATGDISLDTDAPIVVATLETQKQAILAGRGPDLLVIDEYQLIDDPTRGLNYEQVIALAPPSTQLLLLSGSVGNPEAVRDWLVRIGRRGILVECRERPVPLENLNGDAIPGQAPKGVRGYWPTLVAKALAADYGPILLFAPQRLAAERLARSLANMLPGEDLLELTPEQGRLARGTMAKLLRQRVAFHHSGLSYPQRAGLVEPLAKAGQLRVIVATTGLSAGINFSVRTVCVTDGDYRTGQEVRRLRPDELLQMFGRAGRRGIDTVGYALSVPGRPNLAEARPINLRGNGESDWASSLRFLDGAVSIGEEPMVALRRLSASLFRPVEIQPLSKDPLREAGKEGRTETPRELSNREDADSVVEMMNRGGEWERLGRKVRVPLKEAWAHRNGVYAPALSVPECLDQIKLGSLCRIVDGEGKYYGRLVTLATIDEGGRGEVVLTKWFGKALRKLMEGDGSRMGKVKAACTLEELELRYLPRLTELSEGGALHRWTISGNRVLAELRYDARMVFARMDVAGNALLGAPVRKVTSKVAFDMGEAMGLKAAPRRFSGDGMLLHWRELGLVGANLRPTRRGTLFSFFSHAEGLAVAVALEDNSYGLEEIVFDLANLRAGFRFEEVDAGSTRLGDLCRIACHWKTLRGYLRRGVPAEYGNGGSEVVRAIFNNPQSRHEFLGDLIREGDIERLVLEWRSLLRQIVHAPDFEWQRWRDLKELAREVLGSGRSTNQLIDLPPLARHQRDRYVLRAFREPR